MKLGKLHQAHDLHLLHGFTNMFTIKKASADDNLIFKSNDKDLYTYTVYTGKHNLDVEEGDSAWIVNSDLAYIVRGKKKVFNEGMTVVIKGYTPDEKSSRIQTYSNLPYINGCSTHQIFPPIRIGDPTLQLLYMPPNTSEQAHHIHSTVRCVYVLEGSGWSVQGMKDEVEEPLNAGDVLVLDKMTPHHFRTDNSHLVVVPLHVYSSTYLEHDHPMKNGTHKI